MAEGTSDDKQPKTFEEYLKCAKKVKRPRENEAKSAKRALVTAKYHASLTELSLEGRSMKSLENFPTLLELSDLNLSDNALEGDLDNLIENTPKLVTLDLSWNKFSDVKSLTPLTKLTKLEQLAVFECPLTANENYRTEIYELLPNLKYLDGFDRNNNEIKKNTSNGKTDVAVPSNSQEDHDVSNEDGNDTKIYKKFLEEQLSNDDESNDEEFDPDKIESDENGSSSQSTSGADTDDNEDTSSEVSNPQGDDSDSDEDSGTHEPTSKRTRIEETKSDEKDAQ